MYFPVCWPYIKSSSRCDHQGEWETVGYLSLLSGIMVVWFHRIDVYNTKGTKESIFMCEEREAALALGSTDTPECPNPPVANDIPSSSQTAFRDDNIPMTNEKSITRPNSLTASADNGMSSTQSGCTSCMNHDYSQGTCCHRTSFSGILTQ